MCSLVDPELVSRPSWHPPQRARVFGFSYSREAGVDPNVAPDFHSLITPAGLRVCLRPPATYVGLMARPGSWSARQRGVAFKQGHAYARPKVSETTNIALIGLGSAGAQHAVALSQMPGVQLIAGADPRKGRDLFNAPASETGVRDITSGSYFDDEAPMFEALGGQIDGVVIAAEPPRMRHKVEFLRGLSRPIASLWERPVGLTPDDTSELNGLGEGPGEGRIVTFNRFGMAGLAHDLLSSGEFEMGEILGFSAVTSLSIPAPSEKPWRWEHRCPAPIHMLDQVWDTLHYLGVPRVQRVTAAMREHESSEGRFDQTWSLIAELEDGVIGTVQALQYRSDREFGLPLNHLTISSAQCTIEIQGGFLRVAGADGARRAWSADDLEIPSELEPSVSALMSYVIQKQGYPDGDPATLAAAKALVRADWTWIQELRGENVETEIERLRTASGSGDTIAPGVSAVESAQSGRPVAV
jgi:predicted dehydrogenase